MTGSRRRSPSFNGSLVPATVSQMVNIEAPSPMVTAIASPPTSVSPHDRRSMRRPSLPSSQKVSTHGRPRAARAASRNCATPPNSSRASRRACSRLMPRRTLSSSAIARCSSSSWSKSASLAAGRRKSRIRAMTDRTARACVSSPPSPRLRRAGRSWLQHAADDAGDAFPVPGLGRAALVRLW